MLVPQIKLFDNHPANRYHRAMDKKEIKRAVEQAIKTMPQGGAIQRVRLFGSHLHGNATNKSDVDLLVDFNESAQIGLFDLVHIQDKFAESLGAEVDLGTPEGLSKYIRNRVLAEAEILYER